MHRGEQKEWGEGYVQTLGAGSKRCPATKESVEGRAWGAGLKFHKIGLSGAVNHFA